MDSDYTPSFLLGNLSNTNYGMDNSAVSGLFGNSWSPQGGDYSSQPFSWGNMWNQAKSGISGAANAFASDFGQSVQNNHTDLPDSNKFGNIMGGIQTAAGLYGGFKQLGLAQDQFDLQKDTWQKTWDASTKNINESVEYRSKLRNNGNAAATQADIDKYSV
jgi:hypothetical protein